MAPNVVLCCRTLLKVMKAIEKKVRPNVVIKMKLSLVCLFEKRRLLLLLFHSFDDSTSDVDSPSKGLATQSGRFFSAFPFNCPLLSRLCNSL